MELYQAIVKMEEDSGTGTLQVCRYANCQGGDFCLHVGQDFVCFCSNELTISKKNSRN